MPDARQIAEEVAFVAKDRDVDFADVRIVEEESTRAAVQDSRADKVGSRAEAGAGIRVLVDGAWGFVSVDSLSRREMLAALDEATELAKASTARVSDAGVVAEIEAVKADVKAPLVRDPREVAVKDKIDAIKRYEEAARKHGGASIVNSIVSYSDMVLRETIANTAGTLVSQESTTTYLACRVAAVKDGMTQTGSERLGIVGGYELVDNTTVEELSILAVDKALGLLDAKPAPGGKFPIIFDSSATGLFTHEALGHNAEADAVWAGASIIDDKMGQQIAATCVTMVDDPTLEGKFGYYLYDSEGTPARRHVIIENGILKEWLHSLETAARFAAAPNGAARAEGHTARPLVRMSNTFTAPGNDSVEDMIKSIDRGIYLKDAQGGHVFPERGQFTCQAGQAVMIENGKLGEPLRDVSVAGLTLEILNNIEMVGSDFDVAWPGFCGKGGQSVPTAIGGPHLKVSSMVVGGRIG